MRATACSRACRIHCRLVGGLIGGPLTANALVYGLLAALATLTLILTFAAVNAAVGYADLAAPVARAARRARCDAHGRAWLLPQTFAALMEVREAQAVRGLPPARGCAIYRPFCCPCLRSAWSARLTLAEAMAARGFGMPMPPDDGSGDPAPHAFAAQPTTPCVEAARYGHRRWCHP